MPQHEVSPEPSPTLPRNEPELYKGRETACLTVPTAAEPVLVLRLAESDRYGLLMAALPPETSASLELASGERVANAVQDDDSSNTDLIIGADDSAGRAEILRLDGPDGATVCRFNPENLVPTPSCEAAD